MLTFADLNPLAVRCFSHFRHAYEPYAPPPDRQRFKKLGTPGYVEYSRCPQCGSWMDCIIDHNGKAHGHRRFHSEEYKKVLKYFFNRATREGQTDRNIARLRYNGWEKTSIETQQQFRDLVDQEVDQYNRDLELRARQVARFEDRRSRKRKAAG